MKNKGFTLLELLISCAVIAILTSVSFWGYNAKKDTLVLRDETGIVISKVENIRERAIGSQYWHDILPTGGYGIFFTSGNDKQYTTFADCNNNAVADLEETNCNTFMERIAIINLDSRVRIANISAEGGYTSELTIIYKFPFPEAIIKDAGGNIVNNASVELEIVGDPLKMKKINFNSAGLIYVE